MESTCRNGQAEVRRYNWRQMHVKEHQLKFSSRCHSNWPSIASEHLQGKSYTSKGWHCNLAFITSINPKRFITIALAELWYTFQPIKIEHLVLIYFWYSFDTLKSIWNNDWWLKIISTLNCMKWHEKVSNTDVSKHVKSVFNFCPILIGSKVYQSSARECKRND